MSSISSIITSSKSPEEIVERCCRYFDDLTSSLSENEGRFRELLDSILVDSLTVGVSRKVISYIANTLKGLSEEQCLQFSSILSDALKLRIMSFEDQVTEVNLHMAGLYEARKEYTKAASHLSIIPLENSQRNYSKEYTTEMYLRIAHLFLQGSDPHQAELFLNRASLQMGPTTKPQLTVQYNLCYAKALDFRKKFLEAAKRYLELSLEPLLSSAEQSELLRHAILCAIIAPAGLHRSRILSSLCKDERSQHFLFSGMLNNTQLGHLITHEQVSLFEKELEEHQLEKLPSEMSILEAAVMEHNLLAISHIYISIKLDNLAHLLRVTLPQAEKVVGKMISEQRISGNIDQIQGVVFFESATQPWDDHIDVVCNKVNNVIDVMLQCEPAFTKERLQRYRC